MESSRAPCRCSGSGCSGLRCVRHPVPSPLGMESHLGSMFRWSGFWRLEWAKANGRSAGSLSGSKARKIMFDARGFDLHAASEHSRARWEPSGPGSLWRKGWSHVFKPLRSAARQNRLPNSPRLYFEPTRTDAFVRGAATTAIMMRPRPTPRRAGRGLEAAAQACPSRRVHDLLVDQCWHQVQDIARRFLFVFELWSACSRHGVRRISGRAARTGVRRRGGRGGERFDPASPRSPRLPSSR